MPLKNPFKILGINQTFSLNEFVAEDIREMRDFASYSSLFPIVLVVSANFGTML